MKKILFIIYTYSMGGGAETVLTNLVNHLDPKKYQIDILEYAHYGIKEESLSPQVHMLKPIVSMKNDKKIKRLWKNIQVFSFSNFLKKRRKSYDLEISFNYLIPTFLLSGKSPSIAWLHGDIYDLTQRPYMRWKERKALSCVSCIVVISENTRASVVSLYPEFAEKIRVIHNGFNIKEIQHKSLQPCNLSIRQPSLAFVGRLDKNKNPLALIDVVEELRYRGKNINLYFLGEGILQDEIKKQITRKHLEDRIFLLGYQQNPYPVMARCRGLCMMSQSEGFPTVFGEGMALGVPFITTPVGGVSELSNGNQCGIIVHNIKECADAVEKILLNDETHDIMSSNCLNHIAKFSLTDQIGATEQLIDSLLSP